MISSYTKGGPWIWQFRFSNSLYVWATQAIINYTSIGEYHLKIFPREDFSCLCRNYPIESRYHILYDCRRFNKYWNSNRNNITQFVLFLEFNKNAFTFGKNIIWIYGFSVFEYNFCFLFCFLFVLLFLSLLVPFIVVMKWLL